MRGDAPLAGRSGPLHLCGLGSPSLFQESRRRLPSGRYAAACDSYQARIMSMGARVAMAIISYNPARNHVHVQ